MIADPEAGNDYKHLLQAILQQAIDDYTKLYHPYNRRKKYLLEAFLDAHDMLFDSTYRMSYVKNEENEDMSLYDLIHESLEIPEVNIGKLTSYVIDQTILYWEKKPMKTIDIPEQLLIEGHVYTIDHHDQPEMCISWAKKIVSINKKEVSTAEEQLLEAISILLAKHLNLRMDRKDLKALAKAWFRTMKFNNCFTGLEIT